MNLVSWAAVFQQSKSSEMPLHATFMVTGEVATASGRADGDEMDVDAPSSAIGSTSLSCVIVDESNLEGVSIVRAQILRIDDASQT